MWFVYVAYGGYSSPIRWKCRASLARPLCLPVFVCTRTNAVKDNLSLLIICFYKLVISNGYLWLTFPCFPLQKEVGWGSEIVPLVWTYCLISLWLCREDDNHCINAEQHCIPLALPSCPGKQPVGKHGRSCVHRSAQLHPGWGWMTGGSGAAALQQDPSRNLQPVTPREARSTCGWHQGSCCWRCVRGTVCGQTGYAVMWQRGLIVIEGIEQPLKLGTSANSDSPCIGAWSPKAGLDQLSVSV